MGETRLKTRLQVGLLREAGRSVDRDVRDECTSRQSGEDEGRLQQRCEPST